MGYYDDFVEPNAHFRPGGRRVKREPPVTKHEKLVRYGNLLSGLTVNELKAAFPKRDPYELHRALQAGAREIKREVWKQLAAKEAANAEKTA